MTLNGSRFYYYLLDYFIFYTTGRMSGVFFAERKKTPHFSWEKYCKIPQQFSNSPCAAHAYPLPPTPLLTTLFNKVFLKINYTVGYKKYDVVGRYLYYFNLNMCIMAIHKTTKMIYNIWIFSKFLQKILSPQVSGHNSHECHIVHLWCLSSQ